MNAPQEEKIIRRVLSGDVNAFELLVTAYEGQLYRMAYGMLHSREDAGDAVQESFLKAYLSLGSFRKESRFSVWLYRITANCCLDLLRARSKRSECALSDSEGEAIELPDGRPEPEQQLLQKEESAALHRAIAELPAEYRTALLLREGSALSYAEIAAALGIEEGTVKSRIYRARRRLAAVLQPEAGKEGEHGA